MRSLPTMRIASPGCKPVARPSSHNSVSPDLGNQRTRVCTGMAFHSARAGVGATVSKLWACSSCPGTLCTRVPTGITMGSAGAPGMVCSVKARCVPAATPGASS